MKSAPIVKIVYPSMLNIIWLLPIYNFLSKEWDDEKRTPTTVLRFRLLSVICQLDVNYLKIVILEV